MAKSAKPRRKASGSSRKPAPKPASPSVSRRAALGSMAIYGGGAVALVAGGTAFAFDFRRKLAEGDLTRIGNGTPSVVQIHDPSCAMCRSLQKQARAALRDCDDAEARQYLVANIASAEGAAFAGQIGLPHVTLALFDANGRHVHTISGVTPAAEIKADITRFLG